MVQSDAIKHCEQKIQESLNDELENDRKLQLIMEAKEIMQETELCPTLWIPRALLIGNTEETKCCVYTTADVEKLLPRYSSILTHTYQIKAIRLEVQKEWINGKP